MRAFSRRSSAVANRFLMLIALALMCAPVAFAQSQANAADLIGVVTDPNGAVVPGASVTAKDTATGISRSATANESGEYQILGLQPGEYEVTVEAATFKRYVITPVRLTVGQRAELPVRLELGEQTAVVTVDGNAVELIETTRTAVSNTIDQQRIENLPINERSATGFALTLSTVGRDNGRPIGPAPTSGLNIGGQRGRSTQVNVDGVDFTDNSVNAARSTVSQEAVQEYQVATNSYTAEFGRATGGVINVVTKRGTNEFNGNVFGFIRDKRFQARNAFAPVDRPDFRRTQFGATLGGRIVRDKTFFFASYEGRRRDESGFFTTDVTQGLTTPVTIPAIPGLNPSSRTFNNLTAQQAAFVNGLISQGTPLLANPATAATGAQLVCAARAYAFLAGSGSATALNGSNPLASPNDGSACPAISPILPGQIGSRFLLSGAPVPVSEVAFRPLLGLQQIFPVTDRTNYFSIRGDHNFNPSNQLTLRFGYNTSDLTGIQVESQNQSLGQNDFSRTGNQDLTDIAFSTNLNSILSSNVNNEFKFSFGRRNTSFLPQENAGVAFNISGTAFIGGELFSPVIRTENRFQFADNLTWVVGSHTLKFGADINYVEIPEARFELNFAGLFNFGENAAGNLNSAFNALGAACVSPTQTNCVPNFTPVQSYGLGLPSIFIQGFGNPISRIKNTPLAFFAQDSWRINNRLTLNYGLRYDVELTQQIAPVAFQDPLTGINLSESDILAAQNAIGVQQGFPRDTNNFAPRFAAAWDVTGNGKTVIRGSIGLYYDHPLLAVGFNSDIADAAQQQQAVLTPVGGPSSTALLNAVQVFQGTVCVPGATATPVCAAQPAGTFTPGVAPGTQYLFGQQRFNPETFTGFGAVLPFTLPVSQDFEYAQATQANLAIERQLTRDMSVSATYLFVQARNLPHPREINPQNTTLLIQNFQRFAGRLPNSTTEALGFSIPVAPPGSPAGGANCTVVIPGAVANCPLTGGRVVAPAFANFFRPNAPNYFLTQSVLNLYNAQVPVAARLTLTDFNNALTGSLRTPGVVSPFGSVNAQVSDGRSDYNALNLEVKRRFANNFTFLASYTWAHSIDDSSDLQTLLAPQDPFDDQSAERADSLFDQRHRFVFSGVLISPDSWRQGNGWQKFFSDFIVAPIFEISSGRPFNIITNIDTNADQSTQTDRPSVNPDGTLCVPGPGCITPTITDGRFSVGNLRRNMGITHAYASFDLRITRQIRFGERFRLDLIAEGFNLFNRFNEASASPFYADVNAFGQRNGNGKYYSRPTAAYDPRQFQFGAKFNF